MMYIHCGPDGRTGPRTDRHRERERREVSVSSVPQGGEGGGWREGRPGEERAQVPYVTTGGGGPAGCRGAEAGGGSSSLRPPAAMARAQGRQDAGL